MHPLEDFHPYVRRWFERTYDHPSPPQVLGWPAISSGRNTLILAPTGSGKTLAAFLWAINHLVEQHLAERLTPGVRILYVSPLKALNNDIERNLEQPLAGIRAESTDLPEITTAVRTGDTPQSRRAAMIRRPPDILITTPESLYLMLTSAKSRPMLRTVQYVIIDEIHSLCNNKRGAHLSLTLERLQVIADQRFVRIGLSATQRPLERIAAFLGGQEDRKARPVEIIDAGQRKTMDLLVDCAVQDFSTLQQQSVWPLIFDELIALINAHKTTLVFVNNRRLAERIAATLNDMMFQLYAVPRGGQPDVAVERELPPVKAYHGSMSRDEREIMEQELKNGELRALITTSALELGIDIGSVDLVVQVASPKGIARGLQRVGRSGHVVHATSKGRILPTHREDLVEATVVAKRMMEHDVELTTIPENCLDVLAQQIVAMVSVESWKVDQLFATIRQAYCYRSLSRSLYDGVLTMLAGRYAHETFRELRARISWDKVNNVLDALPGSGRLAVTSGGTIADRGYFGVYLEDGSTKVGEVDEEFVYETRVGDTFILGTTVWRVTAIDPNRLSVVPAPGESARMPFWRGESIGRSFGLGTHVGEFRRFMSERLDDPSCLRTLQREYPIDPRAAWNILEYFRKQESSTGVVPHDRQLVLESFRDEIGDPRLVLHSPFGRRINGLLGMVLARRMHERTAVEPQMLYNDDGILLRCPDVETLPLSLLDDLTVKEAEGIVLNDVLSSPLFGGQFRQNAARALLMPRSAPGTRTPMWLQRLRAGDLLQIVRQFDDFPIVIETIREVLNDILDLDHFREIVQQIESGSIRVTSVRTEVPSPFAASLLFDFIAVYMYEWDQPRADSLSQYLSINREILAEVVDLGTLPSLLRTEAVDLVAHQLQHRADGTRARSPEELLEILLRVGDLDDDEVARCCEGDALAMLRALSENGRAVRVTINGAPRWIAGEETGLFADLHNRSHAANLVRRFIQNRGVATIEEFVRRYGVNGDEIAALTQSIAKEENLLRGRFRPDSPAGTEEWAYKPAIERMHRQTLAILRKEITPSTLAQFTTFLMQWQGILPGISRPGGGQEGYCLEQLQGFSLPADVWSADVIPRRCGEESKTMVESMTSKGRIVWVGAGQGRMTPLKRGQGWQFLAPVPTDRESILGEPSRRVLTMLREHGASFFQDVRTTTRLSLDAINNALSELWWGGFITNDQFGELLHVKRVAHPESNAPIEPVTIVNLQRNPARRQLLQKARKALRDVPGYEGRWSLVYTPVVLGEDHSQQEVAAAQAQCLLERYGILARELFRHEDLLPWSAIARELQRMEMRGEIRKGYFVEGLSGMQYALPAAVEELRRVRSADRPSSSFVLINACDPALPYGPGIETPVRINRLPGNYVALRDGVPVLHIEQLGSRWSTVGSPSEDDVRRTVREFLAMVRSPDHDIKDVRIEYWDDQRPASGVYASVLRSAGFTGGPNQTMTIDQYSR